MLQLQSQVHQEAGRRGRVEARLEVEAAPFQSLAAMALVAGVGRGAGA